MTPEIRNYLDKISKLILEANEIYIAEENINLGIEIPEEFTQSMIKLGSIKINKSSYSLYIKDKQAWFIQD